MIPAEPDLFTPVRLGALWLPNRVVMAPMTRCRAGTGNVPTELMARYYAQRASAGLIITEGSQVSPDGQGFVDTPGIHSQAQVEGWRRVTDAVHAGGGRIVLQLWHVGRASHPAYQPGGALPIAPSPIAIPETRVALPDGTLVPWLTPRALETEEVPRVVECYRRGAENARAAGFDGVEIHGANGYLIDQFLLEGSNTRTDRYGGPVAHRARFLLEVTEAVVSVWGADRVGVRLSPRGVYNGMFDPDRPAIYGYAAEQLERFGLAYLHLIDPVPGHRMLGPEALTGPNPVPLMRQRFSGPLIVNGGYDAATSQAALASGVAAISFGLTFLANPDLPERLRRRATLNVPDRATFYTKGERGYTDYPALPEEAGLSPTSPQSTRWTA
jgi:N-ethylmaleimide reductase